MRLKIYRGVWCAVWNEGGDTKRKSLHTTDRGIAERALATLRAEPLVSQHTVAGIYGAYLTEKFNERAVWAWKQLEGPFGHLRPDHITRTLCRGYIAKRRAQEKSDGTIRSELTYLRAALRWHDPRTKAIIELPPNPPPRERYLQRAEYVRLLNSANDPHVRLFIILALATAGRMTAILELTWDRVLFDDGVIRLALGGEKRRKGRANVPITSMARTALEQAVAIRTCDHVIEYAGRPVLNIRKGFATAAVAAGVPWCTPHVLRHTAAVWMAESGTPMAEIAQYLGHSDSRLSERVYARFSPAYLRKAASALDGPFVPSNTAHTSP